MKTLSNNTLIKKIQNSSINDFDKLCYQTLLQVPNGAVLSYKDLACLMGKPNAARAVGSAMARNPFAPNVPCHRVVKSDGTIGGFMSGPEAKIKLLRQEGVLISASKKVDKKWFYKDEP